MGEGVGGGNWSYSKKIFSTVKTSVKSQNILQHALFLVVFKVLSLSLIAGSVDKPF
jgi:hypothetical protein